MRRTRAILAPMMLAMGLAACGQDVAEAGKTPVAEAAAPVAALPLKRGYYVESDTPCGQASNATTTLLRREGIGGARDFCEFKKI